MKLFKKPFAVILALAIVLTSVSIAVFAETEYAGTVTTATKFFYDMDGDGTYETAATDGTLVVKKGTKVRADLYLTTDFLTTSHQMLFVYDSDMLSFDTSKNDPSTTWQALSLNLSNADKYTVRYSDGSAMKSTMINHGFDESKFDGLGTFGIRATKGIVTEYDNVNYFSVYFTVNNTATYDDVGTFKLLEGTEMSIANPYYVTDLDMTTEAGAEGKQWSAEIDEDYVIVPNTSNVDGDTLVLSIKDVTSDEVVLGGNVILDANGGTMDGTEATYQLEDTYAYNDTVKLVAPATAKKSDDGYDLKFLGYSKDKNATTADYTSEAKFMAAATADEKTAGVETYYAVWGSKKITFTATNPETGVETTKDITVGSDYTVTAADVPTGFDTVDGYDLNWPNLTPDADGKITGSYDPATNDIHFFIDGKEDTDKLKKDVTYKTAVSGYLTDPADKTGYTFDGWYTDADCTTKVASDATMPNADLNVYGKFVPNEYTVTYSYTVENADGTYGTPITSEETVKYGDAYTVKDKIEKDGYTFDGWSDLALTDGKYMIADNSTLEGKLNLNTYSIIYVDDNKNVVKEYKEKYTTALDASGVPDYSAYDTEAKTYTGWSQTLPSTMGIYTDTYTAADSTEYNNVLVITLVGKDNEKGTVTFKDADGNTIDALTISDYVGKPMTMPEIPDSLLEDGYDVEWDKTYTTVPSGDTVITAVKTPKNVNVTIENPDGTTTVETVKYNDKVTEPATPTVDEGSEFLGWYLPDGTKFDFSKPISEQADYLTDLTLTPKVGMTDKYYIAESANSDGSFNYGITKTFETEKGTDKEYTVPEIPAMKGYTATTWNTAEDGSGTSVNPGDTVKVDGTSYYAQYEINKYTATFMVDGTEYDTEEFTFGGGIPAPADPTKEGATFAGWVDENGKNLGEYTPEDSIADVTFTATWTSGTYTVTYISKDCLGRDYTYRAYSVDAGDTVTQPEADPTRIGYKFTGWDSEIPDTMPEEDLTFTAQWEVDKAFVAIVIGGVVVSGAVVAASCAANAALITAAVVGGVVVVGAAAVIASKTHKVTYYVDGEVYRTYLIVEGAKVIVPADPTEDGKVFAGWDEDIPDTMPDHDISFNARWGSEIDNEIPDTGSTAAGLAAFAVISSAAATAYVFTKKKKDEE